MKSSEMVWQVNLSAVEMIFVRLFVQDTGEASHKGERRVREAARLQTLLLVRALRGSVPLRPGGSSCALPVDLPHSRSPRGVAGGTAGRHGLSGKLPNHSSELFHHAFILQQEEEHGQHVHHQVHEEVYRPGQGIERNKIFQLIAFRVDPFWQR